MSKDDEDAKPGTEPASGATEDRDAILSRRKFLIESALASAGITIGVAGCGPSKKDTGPQVCLSIAPQPQECLKVAPPRPNVCLSPPPQPPPPQPQECLRVAPQKCLKIAPPRDGGAPRPQVCLSKPRPRPCLSVAPKPSGKICLSDF
jgi:hypothetical protein